MRRLLLPAVLAVAVWAGLAGPATADMYTQTLVHCEWLFDPGRPYEFTHDNPAELAGGGPLTPAQYEAAVAAGLVSDVTLSFCFKWLECEEVVNVWLDPVGAAGWTKIGEVSDNGVSSFDLIAAFGPGGGLDGLPVKVKLEGFQWCLDPLDIAKLKSSTVSVTVGAIPAPGAALLGALGLGLVAWRRRR